MRTGYKIKLSDRDRKRLGEIVADATSAKRHETRARIILMTADGAGTTEIMKLLRTNKSTVWRWQKRFEEEGIEGLIRDRPRKPGKQPTSAESIAAVIDKTCRERPRDGPFWTAKEMAWNIGLARSTVQAIWRDSGIAPHWLRYCRKVHDIVGFYSDSITYALVFEGCDNPLKNEQPNGREMTEHKHWRQQASERRTVIREIRRMVDLSRSVDPHGLTPSQRSTLDRSLMIFLEDVDARLRPGMDLHALIGSLQHYSLRHQLRWFGSRPEWSCSFAPNLNWLDEQLGTLFDKTCAINGPGRCASITELLTAARAAVSIPPEGAFCWLRPE